MPHSIAIIGVGKITQDQHLPVIAKNPNFKLAATVSQRGLQLEGVPSFRTPAELYAAMPEVEVVAICTPPGVRHGIARAALDAGIISLRARSDAMLRIAASMTVAEYLLPGWLTTLRARDPQTAVALTVGNSAEVAEAGAAATAAAIPAGPPPRTATSYSP